MKNPLLLLLLMTLATISFAQDNTRNHPHGIPDKAFLQDCSIKYDLEDKDIQLYRVVSDRNGYIQLLSSQGLLRPRPGQFLYPGTLVTDVQDKPTSDKNISSISIYENQLIYLDDKAVFSNAWAGKLYSKHKMANANIFSAGKDFEFLISDGKNLNLLLDSKTLWSGTLSQDEVISIEYDNENNIFWILGKSTLNTFSPTQKVLKQVFKGSNLTCMEWLPGKILVGTTNGYFEFDTKAKRQVGEIQQKMPWTELTSIQNIDGKIWFGSTRGAMSLKEDGRFNYYASKRWLPSDSVIDIAKGPENSVLILTSGGLGQIVFKEMTLADKAEFFDKQVRERHIRTGFNAILSNMKNGDLTTGTMKNSDNDGLWTSMYLGGEAFRYAVTHSEEALQNVKESLDAMERLYTINPMNSGFPSRSFQRAGYNASSKPWRATEDPEWDWKSTTSSDEAIGHVFVFGVIAELVDVKPVREKAIELLDLLMQHIVDNDLYLVDFDGKPTTWGRWHPDYVNNFPTSVGDRKLNSSNIIAMLQSAYYFTKKEVYKEKAFELIDDYGYLENLMRPMEEIGRAPNQADDWSKMLSSRWNHSDDEMYYMGYWGLYRYAFNDELKSNYRQAIIDHWEAERPEKDGLWNIMTALVGDEDFDFENAIWFLQEFPLDLITWTVNNSHRKDIEVLPANFRDQATKEVLPPDELKIRQHNANRFELDGGQNGTREYSAGDLWLLPYWIGRYLEVIGEPVND
ncbi:ligand-binding sensor domain-containing protein [Membranihabitans marinus]|uniref:hypothetical protein n=1 Tax=Membranihabitans marinus TaxID=1227546 RepID=UPI001F467FF7|nr:hypothetical protein [Membranihabitans marinus]